MKQIYTVLVFILLVSDIIGQPNSDTTRQEKQLDTVTVLSTGYQTIPKERATGSFEHIKEKQLNQQFSTDILSRLESVSTILFDKSRFSQRPKQSIRGVSSINGSKEPLIILDNFPFEGDINTINPNMIESVTILRDAAAASIWGARAGNGVIVITTKKGKYNQPLQVDLVINTSVITKPNLLTIPVINSSEIVDFEKWLFSNGHRFSDTANVNRPAFSPIYEILFKQRRGTISQQEAEEQLNKLKSTDVREDYNSHVYRPAINKQYSISASGGTQKTSYRFSGGYDHNIDNLESKYQRFIFRAESKYRVTNKLTASTVLSYTNTLSQSGKTAYAPTSEFLYLGLLDEYGIEIPRYRYRQPYLDTAGRGKLLDWKYYPLRDYKHSVRETKLDHLLANFILQYQLLNSLHISANYQWESQKSLITHQQGLESYYTRDLINKFSQINPTTNAVTNVVPKGDIIDRSYTNLNSRNFRTQLSYNKETSVYTVSAITGGEIRERKDLSNSYRIYGFDPNSLSLFSIDYMNTYPNYITRATERIPSNLSETDKNIRYVSLFANAGFNYKQKYGLSASARRDASNLFGVNTNQKWTPQWSAGVSWIISNENFLSKTFFQFLKLRASYGTSGNVDQRRSAVTTIRYLGSASVAGFPFAQVSQFPNPSLRWEKISMVNVGLDFSMFNSRINGSFELFSKKGTDLFGTTPIDYTTGVGILIDRNVANTKGNGFDFSLNGRVISSKVKWDISLLLSYAKTEVTKYYLATDGGNLYISDGGAINPLEGKPIFSVVSYPWAGLDVQGNPLSLVAGQPSSNYSAIVGGQIKVGDLIYSGPALPTLYGSVGNSIAYKRIELSFTLNYKLGHFFRRQSVSYTDLFQNSISHSDYLKRWKNAGDEKFTSIPSLQYPNNSERSTFYSNSAILATKGDHMRLSFINLGYTINRQSSKNLPFQYIQLALNASNLGIIWRANKYNIDPEYAEMSPGKQLSIGIKAGF